MNAAEVKRKKLWVEYNYEKAQKIKITQAKYAKITISTCKKD